MLAKKEAEIAYNKDVSFRIWAASHGGVYVPESERTPANPNLSHIPERDIVTPSGRRLTLMNPAYVLRQMMNEFSELYGPRGHITSIKPLNPMNAPNDWQRIALLSFERGGKEFFEFKEENDTTYLRLMRPLVTQKDCLKCHAKQGYKEGDIRGGVGVSLDMKSYFQYRDEGIRKQVTIHSGIWAMGMIGIGFVGWLGRARALERQQAKQKIQETELRYQDIYENAPDMFVSVEAKTGSIVRCNQTLADNLGFSKNEIIGKNILEVYHPDCHQGAEKAFHSFVATGEVRDTELQLQRKDGSKIEVSLKVSAVKDDAGNILFSRSIWRDITEKKVVERELEKQRENLEKTVGELEERECALKTSESRFRTLVNNIPGVVYRCKNDPSWTMVYISPQVYELTGYLDIDFIENKGKSFSSIIHPEDRKIVWEKVQSGLEKKEPYEIQYRIINSRNQIRWVLEHGAGSLDDEGNVQWLDGVIVDLTHQKLTEEELEKYQKHLEQMVKQRTSELEIARDEAESADRLKTLFIASMSHELRTPLNSIIGFTGVLLEGMAGQINPKQKDYLNRAHRSSKHLLGLISDVIDIAKIESGKVEPFPEIFNLRDVIDEAVDCVPGQELKSKGVELKLKVPSELKIFNDRKRIFQCVLNFLSNAVKFTESGYISILAQEVGDEVEIVFEDTGIGISEDNLPKLFQQFERLDNAYRITKPGTGLGLYLTKKLATQVLGGSVGVESRLGVGS